MGSIKLKIHPLTFLVALFYGATGKLGVFIVYTITAFIHELGHYFVAEKKGYALGKICFMPFGAVISGEAQDFSSRDEIKIALAGPIINLVVGVFFIALWWVFPEIYPFTDLAVEANLVLSLINFLPAYPLDGGRILCASLSLFMKRKTAYSIVRGLGIALSLSLLGLFIATCFYQVNVSILFFSLFVFFGATSKEKQNVYVRIFSFPSKVRLKKGVEVKRQAIDVTTSVKELMQILDPSVVNEIIVFDGEKQVRSLKSEEVIDIIKSAKIHESVSNFI